MTPGTGETRNWQVNAARVRSREHRGRDRRAGDSLHSPQAFRGAGIIRDLLLSRIFCVVGSQWDLRRLVGILCHTEDREPAVGWRTT